MSLVEFYQLSHTALDTTGRLSSSRLMFPAHSNSPAPGLPAPGPGRLSVACSGCSACACSLPTVGAGLRLIVRFCLQCRQALRPVRLCAPVDRTGRTSVCLRVSLRGAGPGRNQEEEAGPLIHLGRGSQPPEGAGGYPGAKLWFLRTPLPSALCPGPRRWAA